MVELHDVHIGYNQSLFSIDTLHLERGRLVALIGPNGVGKTTFLNTLLGSISPLKGVMTIEGKEVTQLKTKEKVKLISFVPSKFQGVSHLTVYDLIAMGRAPHTNLLHHLTEKDKTVVNQVIGRLGLDQLAEKFTTQISDGERQLAMIGKAIVQETPLLLLDEPTAFLDYANRIKITSILKELAEQYNKLILMSTHDIDIALSKSSQLLAVIPAEQKLQLFSTNTDKADLVRKVFEV